MSGLRDLGEALEQIRLAEEQQRLQAAVAAGIAASATAHKLKESHPSEATPRKEHVESLIEGAIRNPVDQWLGD